MFDLKKMGFDNSVVSNSILTSFSPHLIYRRSTDKNGTSYFVKETLNFASLDYAKFYALELQK